MPETDYPVFRHALQEDAEAVFELLTQPAERGLILPRTLEEIAARAGEYLIAEQDGYIVGCVTLKDYGQGLHEIRSLAVAPEESGKRIGSTLVERALEEARKKTANRVFALTYRPHLFERLRFKRVPKSQFPQKVWDDCSRCPERRHCREIALVLMLGRP